ncbi:MAG: amidohydrolase family protein, partial [Gammaproteobacteria bacterium]
MAPNLLLRRALLAHQPGREVDIAISDGRIAAIEPEIAADGPAEDLGGRLVLPGFVDTHIHLDKSCILDRCRAEHGTLEEAIAQVAAAKRAFTEQDIYDRARRTLEKAIVQGTTRMRTHVEVDPRVGLRSFDAIRRLKADYAWAIDLELCVFPQEGLLNDPGTEELLIEACERGADLIGGCPYTDSDPDDQIDRIFGIAQRFDLDIDFHLDFDLDPSWMHLDEVCRQTERRRWGGRVAIGHVTKLSAIE